MSNNWFEKKSSVRQKYERYMRRVDDMYKLAQTYEEQLDSMQSRYVPRNPKEPDEVYKTKLMLCMCMEVVKDGVNSTAGAIPQNYDYDFSDFNALGDILNDLTGSSNSATSIANKLIKMWSLRGAAPWMVHMPSYPKELRDADGNVSIKDKKFYKIYPRVRLLDPLDVLELSSSRGDGITLPERLRYEEKFFTYTHPVTKEKSNTELSAHLIVIYDKDSITIKVKVEGDKEFTDLAPTDMTKVPGHTHPFVGSLTVGDDGDYGFQMPPFVITACYQSVLMLLEANLNNAALVAAIPFLFGKDMDALGKDNEIQHSSVAFVKGGKDSDLKFVESSGGAAAIAEKRIEKTEEKAKKSAGAVFQSTAMADAKATVAILEAAQGSRYLQDIMQSVEDEMTRLLKCVATLNNTKLPDSARLRIIKKKPEGETPNSNLLNDDKPKTSTEAFINNTVEATEGVK